MLKKSDMYGYQNFAVEHIVDRPGAGEFIEMGLGKTVSALTATVILMERGEVKKTLVIAPKKVAESVWTVEVQNWQHLQHLRVSLVLGTEKQRKAALLVKADIYVTNVENLTWLIAHHGSFWPYDQTIFDESSMFKNPQSKRFKNIRTVLPKIKRRIILTGTPRTHSLLDLWSQVYLLDRGERLGVSFEKFREQYFTPARSNEFTNFKKYEVVKEADPLLGEDMYEKIVYDKISDICVSMQQKDFLELPPFITQDKLIKLPSAVYERYLEFEKERVLAIAEEELTAVNASVLAMKLLQFASGAVYDENKVWHEVHDEKIEALIETMDAANGEPVIVFYWFKSSLARIMQHLKAYRPVALNGPKEIELWNTGKIRLLLAQPMSAGHGLNLQFGGRYSVWFDNTYNLGAYQQGCKRLHRPGQDMPVINQRLIAQFTTDENVIAVQEGKAKGQEGLMQHVKALIKKYK